MRRRVRYDAHFLSAAREFAKRVSWPIAKAPLSKAFGTERLSNRCEAETSTIHDSPRNDNDRRSAARPPAVRAFRSVS